MLKPNDPTFNPETEVSVTNEQVPAIPETTPEQFALNELRLERDALLKQTDWVVIRAQEAGQPVPAEWVEYRQALRDLPSTYEEVPLHPKYQRLDWSKIVLPVKPE